MDYWIWPFWTSFSWILLAWRGLILECLREIEMLLYSDLDGLKCCGRNWVDSPRGIRALPSAVLEHDFHRGELDLRHL